MKLVSYAHVHRDLRLAEREREASSCNLSLDLDLDLDLAASSPAAISRAAPPAGMPQLRRHDSGVQDADASRHYPESVSLRGLLYFVLAPTLCYQARYTLLTMALLIVAILGVLWLYLLWLYFYQEYFPRTSRIRPAYLASLVGQWLL